MELLVGPFAQIFNMLPEAKSLIKVIPSRKCLIIASSVRWRAKIVVSSAESQILVTLINWKISLINALNSKGPRSDTLGTPNLISFQ